MGRIFIESRPVAVFWWWDHTYIVYQDDNGRETVIRGGPSGSPPSFGDIILEINVPIEDSDDARGEDTPEDRGQVELDLNGNGTVETLGRNPGVFFDLDNSGFAERTSWVAPGDGLLVLDRNRNNQIDGGAELFGAETLLSTGGYAENGYALNGIEFADGTSWDAAKIKTLVQAGTAGADTPSNSTSGNSHAKSLGIAGAEHTRGPAHE